MARGTYFESPECDMAFAMTRVETDPTVDVWVGWVRWTGSKFIVQDAEPEVYHQTELFGDFDAATDCLHLRYQGQMDFCRRYDGGKTLLEVSDDSDYDEN